MCTISLTAILNQSDGFILTSNRDEAAERATFPPGFYTEEDTRLLFPKDSVAGGSWVGASSKKRVLCLMNGEFKPHKRKPEYRKSRGLVLKDWLMAEDIESEIKNYDLLGIEEFTVIIADWSRKLFFAEFVWDGSEKHFKKLEQKPQIWSSSPLYSLEMKKLRKDWFDNFQQQKDISAENLWEFHHSAGTGNKEIDLIIDRGFLKTKSISQIIYQSGVLKFIYEDLQNKKITRKEWQF